MRILVDRESGALHLVDAERGERWPVLLDPQTGAARVEIGATTLEAHPLGWRQKLLLARYASQGEAFLRRQMLRFCGCSEGGDDASGDALWALTSWVNFPPDAGAALPLQADALARVTTEVCRHIGLRPADLDERDALEVESLWYACGGGEIQRLATSPAVPDSRLSGVPAQTSDVTVIRVVPPPPGVQQHLTPAAGLETAREMAPESGRPATAVAHPATVLAIPARQTASHSPLPAERRAAVSQMRPVRIDPPRPEPVPPPAEILDSPELSGAAQATPAAPTAGPDVVIAPLHNRAAQAIRASPPAGAGSTETVPALVPPEAGVDGLPLDALIEALADRLAQAASDLGVDMET